MSYQPRPFDTSAVQLPPELIALRELLAENTHENRSAQRMKDGWTYGPKRDDALKQHPGLVPYIELSEAEKDYDRRTSEEALKTIIACGFQIAQMNPDAPVSTSATNWQVF